MALETRVNITKDMILERVSELEIFEAFCPTSFYVNKPFSSPFRRDRNPSFVITQKDGYYYFMDYGRSEFRGDAFDFVKLMTNASTFPETLDNVDSKLGLGLKTNCPKEISYRKKEEAETSEQADESKIIQAEPRRFNKDAANYWNKKYHLDLSDLKRHKDVQTYFIDRVWINKKLFYINYDELCFGHFFNEQYWKIYRPFADQEKGEWKWISNVPFQQMYGLDNLVGYKSGLGAKSVKDYYVLSKIKPEVCGTQAENIAAISDENASRIDANCTEFYLYFDNDIPGIKASTELCNYRKWKWVNNPNWMRKFSAKDPSDMVEVFTPEALEYHLKCKNII